MVLLTERTSGSLKHLHALGTLLLWGCCVQLQYDDLLNLICHVWLLSPKNLFFSNERQKWCGSVWEGRQEGTGKSKGKGNYQYVVYEKKIHFQ